MKILVAYATKYGTTRSIGERIAERLRAAGHDAQACPMAASGDLATYDGCVIGSAAYIGSWLKDATEFVRRNQAVLATKPVWLFNSGPLGTEPTDAQGRSGSGSCCAGPARPGTPTSAMMRCDPSSRAEHTGPPTPPENRSTCFEEVRHGWQRSH